MTTEAQSDQAEYTAKVIYDYRPTIPTSMVLLELLRTRSPSR